MSYYIEQVKEGRMTRNEVLRELSKAYPAGGALFEKQLKLFLKALGR